VPSISVPLSKKDLWLNLNSDKSILSWFNVLKDRRLKDLRRKSKSKVKVNSDKKCGWRNIYFELDSSSFFGF
jgi:hypothetical protein